MNFDFDVSFSFSRQMAAMYLVEIFLSQSHRRIHLIELFSAFDTVVRFSRLLGYPILTGGREPSVIHFLVVSTTHPMLELNSIYSLVSDTNWFQLFSTRIFRSFIIISYSRSHSPELSKWFTWIQPKIQNKQKKNE